MRCQDISGGDGLTRIAARFRQFIAASDPVGGSATLTR